VSGATIRPLARGDEEAAGALLDETMGAGFHDVATADPSISLVAEDTLGLVGVIAATPVGLPVARRDGDADSTSGRVARCPRRPFGVQPLGSGRSPPVQRENVSGDQVRRVRAHSGSSRHTNLSTCRSCRASISSSRVFITNGP